MEKTSISGTVDAHHLTSDPIIRLSHNLLYFVPFVPFVFINAVAAVQYAPVPAERILCHVPVSRIL